MKTQGLCGVYPGEVTGVSQFQNCRAESLRAPVKTTVEWLLGRGRGSGGTPVFLRPRMQLEFPKCPGYVASKLSDVSF